MTAGLTIEDFGMTRHLGFLGASGVAETPLPGSCRPIVEAGEALPEMLVSDSLRTTLAALPDPVSDDLLYNATDEQLRALMVRYSFLVQAYVWCDAADPADRLPASLAVPIWRLANRLGLKPLLLYQGYVLDNWALLDDRRPAELGNVRMVQKFLGGLDEAWFVLVHVAIEARAGSALALFEPIVSAARRSDFAKLESLLGQMNAVWDDVNAIFDRMPEACDPYIYFNRVRPYIHGWKDNPALPQGIIYEDVEEAGGKPLAFRGQTGSQSSIVPAMDALLQIGHDDDPLKAFLDDLHAYRPPEHRRFIEAVRAESSVRETVSAAKNRHLTEAYNTIVRQVARFRTRHLEYAASYIHKQTRAGSGNDTDVGTGGTPFMKYLKKHRDESEKHLLPSGN